MADVKTEIKVSVWPSPQDYNEAIQNLVANTSDALLKTGHVQTTGLGLPRSVTGAFASVYRVAAGKSDLAVRCFLRDISDQESRYKLISDFVQNDSLPYTVSFDFMTKGIHVGNAWYPALKMDWVEGTNLDLYVERFLHTEELQKLPAMFKKMCVDLQEAGIAHGDLQHGNIIVCGDELRLVDYDGMYVPAMQGMLANELGHRNYQHPLRTAEEFGPHLDNFSAWVIYASLRAVAIDKTLWELLGGGDDCLLFRRDDFVDPEHSYSFAVLEHHPNGEIRALAKFLRWQCHNAVRDVPPLSDEIPSPPSFVGDLTAVITKKRKAPQTFAQVQKQSLSQTAQGPAANKNLPEWIHTNSKVSAVVAARARPKAPPSRAQLVSGPEQELNQPTPRAVMPKQTGLHPVQRTLVQYGSVARTTKLEVYVNTDPFNKSKYMVHYQFLDPISKEEVIATRAISEDLYRQLKDVTEATVMCDPIDPGARNCLYELAAYRAVIPIVPTGIENELKPVRRRTKFKEMRYVNPNLITFILTMPMIAAIAGGYAAAQWIGHLVLVSWFLLLWFAIWRNTIKQQMLVGKGIPARAIIYSIEHLGTGDVKVEYGFMSVHGMIKASVKASETDLHGLNKGDVLTVLYDLHNPSNNLVYQLAVYSAV